MTNFKRASSLILTVITLAFLISCKDDEPSGPAGALGKSFNLAIDKVTSSLAYSLLVSPDGTKILASMVYNNTELYYSTDGGTTFTRTAEGMFLHNFLDIDNQGNILTDDDRVFNNGTFVNSVSTFDKLILGSNGKLFSYNANSGAIKYSEAGTITAFTDLTLPATSTPGAAYYVMRAAGKGLLYLEVKSGTVKAFILDESTMQWNDAVTFTYDYQTLNACGTLSRYERFAYSGSNIITVKGCTGLALLDLTNSNTTYINFPDVEEIVDTDIRDGQLFIDSKKQVYFTARSYADISNMVVHKYDGSSWTSIDGFIPMENSVSNLATDQAGHIYYNTSNGAGESVKGTVKVDVDNNTKTGLALPTTSLVITDAAGTGNDHLMIVVGSELYDYDISQHKATHMGLTAISHINVLSDGRFVAGGNDHVYISTDDGKNWTETKNLFSSVDATKGNASVTRSRIINGKIVMTGVYQYYYDNLSLGVRQTRYDDIAIEFSNASAMLPYQFPADFLPSAIGPDGIVYGIALFVNEFGTTTDRYELKPGTAPERLETKGISPQIVTDEGLQLAISPKQSGGAFEIVSRSSSTGEWASTNTTLPGTFTGENLLRQSGDKLVYVHQTEVYLSGN